MTRWGIYAPFEKFSLDERSDFVDEMETLGYSGLWTAEANWADGLTPLVLAAARQGSLRLGLGTVPSFIRGPALLAMNTAALCRAAPGCVTLTIGSSSDVIVGRRHGMKFSKPLSDTRKLARDLAPELVGS